MTITTPDAELVAGHLAGDSAALAGMYDRFADSLHDTAAAMLNNRDDAADVMHDVFLIAASKMDQLRDPTRLKPWLFAILRNEVYRRTKQRKRTIATDFSNDDTAAASGIDMTDERGLDAASEAVENTELGELVRGAARGLDERDQLVLELSVRQGLDGQDLADALGVSANQSYTLVHRMRERVEKSLGAFCVAKAARKDCADLDAILSRWDGEFTVLIRKRVARHIERCEACADSRRKFAPLALFGAAPVLAAPPALRDRVLGAVQLQSATFSSGGAPSTPYEFTADGGFPRITSGGRKLAAWIAPTAAASVMLVVAGAGLWLLGNEAPSTFESSPAISAQATTTTATAPPPNTVTTTSTMPVAVAPTPPTTDALARSTTTLPPPTAPPTTTPPSTQVPEVAAPPRVTNPPRVPTTTAPPPPAPAAGQLTGSATSVGLGGASTGPFTLSNPGGQPVRWNASGAEPFVVSPAAGSLAPGSSMPITISIDRSNLAEGSGPSATVTFSGVGGQAVLLAVSASVDRPPTISNINASDVSCVRYVLGSGTQTLWEFFISAAIADESGGTATFTISGPGGRSGSGSAPFGPSWSGSANNFPNGDMLGTSPSGTWNWTVIATDSRGNSSSTSGSSSANC